MKKKSISIVALLMVCVCIFTCNTEHAYAASYAPQLAYVLKGLPKSTAIQNFSITSNAVYVVQKENTKE